ncbi:MAG: hypothetical protein HY645_15375 [Acidobacteria bacterium]|nr:hypothetical protein [Acidobacteriota bacterium]
MLFEAITALRDCEECARFFRDLCTLAELQAMAERWEVASMLARELPYRRISELTGASTATVTRVAHWVNHGEGGYRMILERLGLSRTEDAGGTDKHET